MEEHLMPRTKKMITMSKTSPWADIKTPGQDYNVRKIPETKSISNVRYGIDIERIKKFLTKNDVLWEK